MTTVNAILGEATDKRSLLNFNDINDLLPSLLARACDVTMEIDPSTKTTVAMETPLVDMSAFRDTKITTDLTPSVLSLSDNMTGHYSKQHCSRGKACDTFCFTNVR